MNPAESLVSGLKVLGAILQPAGYEFRLVIQGPGSGGNYAQAEFTKGTRKLELHYRYSLGLVTYHIGEESLTHEEYMKLLKKSASCSFPTFASEGLAPFEALAKDIALYCQDFVSGNGELFIAFSQQLKANPMMFSGIAATEPRDG